MLGQTNRRSFIAGLVRAAAWPMVALPLYAALRQVRQQECRRVSKLERATRPTSETEIRSG
jgi:hypothetical protein